MERKIYTTISEEEITEIVNQKVEQAINKDADKLPNYPEILSRKEVAELLGISLVTLWTWSKKGIIPSYVIGTRIRYKKAEVLKALNVVETIKYRRA